MKRINKNILTKIVEKLNKNNVVLSSDIAKPLGKRLTVKKYLGLLEELGFVEKNRWFYIKQKDFSVDDVIKEIVKRRLEETDIEIKEEKFEEFLNECSRFFKQIEASRIDIGALIGVVLKNMHEFTNLKKSSNEYIGVKLDVSSATLRRYLRWFNDSKKEENIV